MIMTVEEKLKELYVMLESAGFPEFVKTAIEDVIARGHYEDSFVDSVHAHVKGEVELLKSCESKVYAKK